MEALTPAPAGRLPARVQSILFACSENAVRSPMAEALARHRLGGHVFVASAGLRLGQPNVFAVAALDEVGLDLSGHRPRTFEDLQDESFDLIITLSPEAHHRALEFTRSMAVDVNYWPTVDPTVVEGSRDAVMTAFRAVRDGLGRRIEAELTRAG